MVNFGAVRRPSGALEEGLEPAQVAEALGDAGTVGWIDFLDAAPDELHALEGLFGFHPLAIEDAQNADTRPKIEEYDNFLFVVTRAINHNPGAEALDLITLSVFLNRHVIVTVHPRPMRSVATAIERLRKHPELLASGPDRLLHHLLDHVVDHYFPILEELEDRIEDLETAVFQAADPTVLERIFDARKEIVVLRRSLGPLREVVTNLLAGVPYVDQDLRPFFRDVSDHVLRLLEELETNREILSGLLESHLSQTSNRMNAVMKRLTALTVVGLPFTVISGFFGMNFDIMPWLKASWGVAAATGLMVALSAGALVLFRRMDWL